MPSRNEVTTRTKRAVRTWSDPPKGTLIFLDTILASLRPNYMTELRASVNGEFEGENNMPISAKDWNKLNPKTVRMIRDEVNKRV